MKDLYTLKEYNWNNNDYSDSRKKNLIFSGFMLGVISFILMMIFWHSIK